MTRRFAKLTFAAVIGALLAGTSIAQAEPFRLIVTDLETPLVPNSVMDLALAKGYFEAEGVDVELVRVQQTPSAVAAIMAGEGEMANIGLDALLQLVSRGVSNLKAVTSPNKSLPFLIASKSDIETPADLVGRDFGVGRVGSLDHTLSMTVLKALDVDVDAVNIVSLGQPGVRAQTLAAGQVDATTMSIGVWLSIPEKDGLHVLVSQDEYYAAAPLVSKVNVVSADALKNRPDDVEAVVRALIKASRDFVEDSSVWVDAMAEARPDIDRAQLEQLAENFAGSWSVNGGMNRQELDYSVTSLYEGEDFAGLEPVPFESWADLSIVDAVLAEIGTAPDLDQPVR